MVKRKHSSVAKRLARVERELEADKPEVKTLDVISGSVGVPAANQPIYSSGINIGSAAAPNYVNYDLTRGFVQGLLNTGGNIDGNYCKLTSMDFRVFMRNVGTASPVAQVRLMIVRVPAAEQLTPADIQTQVLEYGAPALYGELSNVSPLKRNSTINGGYDVMYDRVHSLCSPIAPAANNAAQSLKSTKFIHFRKKWKKGLTLRFSGTAAALTLEQNRLFLFAMDVGNPNPTDPAVQLSFINRLRYSDE